MEWQPIETAPKDGTEFQAWTVDGEWQPRAAWVTPDGFRRGEKNKETFCARQQVAYDGIEGWYGDVFTHWMPRPSAPTEDNQ